MIAILYSRRTQPVVAEAQQALAQVTTQAEESVVGVRVIKAFGQERQEVDRFRDRAQFIVITHQAGTMEAADALYGYDAFASAGGMQP